MGFDQDGQVELVDTFELFSFKYMPELLRLVPPLLYVHFLDAAFELQSASVPLISDDICKQEKVYGRNVTEGMFCAGYLDNNSIDACDGDSGGPLVCEEEGNNARP